MKLNLLEGEQIITESGDKSLTLTNYRIRMSSKSFGHADMQSIMLDKISMIQMKYRTNIYLLVAGIAVILLSLFFAKQLFLLGAIIGAALIYFFYSTRSHVISITADCGQHMVIMTQGIGNEKTIDFIDKVEGARKVMLTKKTSFELSK